MKTSLAGVSPPGTLPAATRIRVGGPQGDALGKPLETMGRKARSYGGTTMLRSTGCTLANHGKPWDAKPEAKALFSAMPARLHGKLWETMGRKARS